MTDDGSGGLTVEDEDGVDAAVGYGEVAGGDGVDA